jgi:hypothetical protein
MRSLAGSVDNEKSFLGGTLASSRVSGVGVVGTRAPEWVTCHMAQQEEGAVADF